MHVGLTESASCDSQINDTDSMKLALFIITLYSDVIQYFNNYYFLLLYVMLTKLYNTYY